MPGPHGCQARARHGQAQGSLVMQQHPISFPFSLSLSPPLPLSSPWNCTGRGTCPAAWPWIEWLAHRSSETAWSYPLQGASEVTSGNVGQLSWARMLEPWKVACLLRACLYPPSPLPSACAVAHCPTFSQTKQASEAAHPPDPTLPAHSQPILPWIHFPLVTGAGLGHPPVRATSLLCSAMIASTTLSSCALDMAYRSLGRSLQAGGQGGRGEEVERDVALGSDGG